MKRHIFTKTVIAFLFITFSISMANAQEATRVVTNLYQAHKVKNVVTWSKAELKKYFTVNLAGLIYKAAYEDTGIDFDILYNTQDDTNITNFKIGNEDSYHQSSGRTVYTVTASFKNFGKGKQVFFTLDPDGYKIEEIDYYGLEESLTEMLTAEEETKLSAAEVSPGIISGQKEPKTVTDFYLLLPYGSYDLRPEGGGDSYLFREPDNVRGTAAITKFRKSLIKIEDIKNGYLKLGSDMWEGGWVEITLFKKTDGSYLVALSNVECGPGCGGDVEFLTYKSGKWSDVTKEFFPKLSKAQDDARNQGCYFKLPRVGRTLKMWCGDEDDDDKGREFGFEWNGTSFIGK